MANSNYMVNDRLNTIGNGSMNEVTEAIYSEKVTELSAEIESRNQIIMALVFKISQGKNVTIPRGVIKQAATTIDRVTWRTMSSGELRITVTKLEREKE